MSMKNGYLIFLLDTVDKIKTAHDQFVLDDYTTAFI